MLTGLPILSEDNQGTLQNVAWIFLAFAWNHFTRTRKMAGKERAKTRSSQVT